MENFKKIGLAIIFVIPMGIITSATAMVLPPACFTCECHPCIDE